MPFYGDDFWESGRVVAMDDEAVALYMWLLWHEFKTGDLPPENTLRRLAMRWSDRWETLWPQVMPCFKQLANGHFRNARCHGERKAALARSEAARQSGIKSAQSRKAARNTSQRTPNDRSAIAEESLSGSSTLILSSLNEPNQRKRPPPGGREPEPEGGSPLAGEPGQAGRAQARYDAFRREQGWSSLNATSWAEIVRQIGALRVEEAVSNAIANGWKTLHAPKRDPFGSRLEDYPLVTATHDARDGARK